MAVFSTILRPRFLVSAVLVLYLIFLAQRAPSVLTRQEGTVDDSLSTSNATHEILPSLTPASTPVVVHTLPPLVDFPLSCPVPTDDGRLAGTIATPMDALSARATSSIFDTYVAKYHAMRKGELPPRFILVTCSAGFGNNLLSFLSAGMYALMSDRVLIGTCFPPDIFSPRGYSHYLETVLAEEGTTSTVSDLLLEAQANGTSPTSPELHEMYGCEDYHSGVYGSSPVIVVRSYNFHGPVIFRHPSHGAAWNELFGTTPAAAYEAALAFFAPPSDMVFDSLRALTLPHIVSRMSGSVSKIKTIGMQIRGGDWFPGKGQAVDIWNECARHLLLQDACASNIYVATDVPANVALVGLKFGAERVLTHPPHPDLASDAHLVLEELLALALTDGLVLTQGSTFGYVAALYQATLRDPLLPPAPVFRTFAYTNDQRDGILAFPELQALVDDNPYCVRVSSEPCFHGFKDFKTSTPACIKDTSVYLERYRSDSFPYC